MNDCKINGVSVDAVKKVAKSVPLIRFGVANKDNVIYDKGCVTDKTFEEIILGELVKDVPPKEDMTFKRFTEVEKPAVEVKNVHMDQVALYGNIVFKDDTLLKEEKKYETRLRGAGNVTTKSSDGTKTINRLRVFAFDIGESEPPSVDILL